MKRGFLNIGHGVKLVKHVVLLVVVRCQYNVDDDVFDDLGTCKLTPIFS